MLALKGIATPKIVTSGGTVTKYTYSNITYTLHTFRATGTFNVYAKGTTSHTFDIFVVAGGGSGGGGSAGGYASNMGSGGGAGGVIWRPAKALDTGSYTITVGATATWPSTSHTGTQGNNSEFGTGGSYILQALGGGRGGGDPNSLAGLPGGCGSGTGRDGGNLAGGVAQQKIAAGGHGDSRTYGYGMAGGTAGGGTSCTSAGGAGGAGQVGYNGGYDCQRANDSGTRAYGGNGIYRFVDGTAGNDNGSAAATIAFFNGANAGVGFSDGNIYIAGGGGGSFEAQTAFHLPSGGRGGGGRGGGRYGGAGSKGGHGIAYSGSGGGAGQMHQNGNVGGDGASGIVIIRYVA